MFAVVCLAIYSFATTNSSLQHWSVGLRERRGHADQEAKAGLGFFLAPSQYFNGGFYNDIKLFK